MPMAGLLHTEMKEDTIVICGYGELGQAVCEALSVGDATMPYAVFDLNPARVAAGIAAGVPIFYGNGASAEVIRATGIESPRAVIITYAGAEFCCDATQILRGAFPETRI